jgi:sirohydrochlorin ferrochelatase
MTDETLLLVGRDTPHTREVGRTHARRLEERGVVDEARAVWYEQEPERELVAEFESVAAETVYAAPLAAAHTHETATDVPAALRHVPGEVRYLDPIGREAAVTSVLAERAAATLAPAEPTSLVLVALGNSSGSSGRDVAEYHARRLEARSAYDDVTTSYLLQNPAVECARYGVAHDRIVAVPLFLAHGPTTREQIPAKLDLDRGGIAYADPLGTHERITKALAGELRKRRAVGEPSTSATAVQPVATDGKGHPE